jgi:hypothetical protein
MRLAVIPWIAQTCLGQRFALLSQKSANLLIQKRQVITRIADGEIKVGFRRHIKKRP